MYHKLHEVSSLRPLGQQVVPGSLHSCLRPACSLEHLYPFLSFSRGCCDLSRDCFDLSQDCFGLSRDCFDLARDCFELSQGCFERSQDCFDLSQVCFELSQGCFEVSQGCFELSWGFSMNQTAWLVADPYLVGAEYVLRSC